ncbi:MAG: hypothetical protein V1802_01715 [Candidatus Aenigmatarchaeota archaeon]
MKGLVELIIAFGFVVASTVVVASVVSSLLQEGQQMQSLDDAASVMSSIDSVARDLLIEQSGSERMLVINTKGVLSVDPDNDKITLAFDSNLEPSTVIQKSGMTIQRGPFTRAYEADMDNDGNDELVLENSFIKFAVNKTGNAGNQKFINTTTFIRLLQNKPLGINSTPTTYISINGIDNSSYGLGYITLTEKGSQLKISSIRLWLNSTSGIIYEALFSLGAGNDFVTFEVVKIEE